MTITVKDLETLNALLQPHITRTIELMTNLAMDIRSPEGKETLVGLSLVPFYREYINPEADSEEVNAWVSVNVASIASLVEVKIGDEAEYDRALHMAKMAMDFYDITDFEDFDEPDESIEVYNELFDDEVSKPNNNHTEDAPNYAILNALKEAAGKTKH
jgi:hypothetical protein